MSEGFRGEGVISVGAGEVVDDGDGKPVPCLGPSFDMPQSRNSTFDEVMAEEWKASEYISELLVKEGPCWEYRARFADCGALPGLFNYQPQSRSRDRLAIAILGKSALALVLKHEWAAEDYTNTGKPMCPECWAVQPSKSGPVTLPGPGPAGHKLGCAWGAIVAEAKKLRGET